MTKLRLSPLAVAVIAIILTASTAYSFEIKPASGCGDCDYCRMKIEGIDMAKVKELSRKAHSEVMATKNGMITVITLGDEPEIGLFHDYHRARAEKVRQLDKGESTKACECCNCYQKALARNSGQRSEDVVSFKRGIIQLVSSQDKDEIQKLHAEVESLNNKK